MKDGQSTQNLVEFSDPFLTLADLCCISTAMQLSDVSLKPVLENNGVICGPFLYKKFKIYNINLKYGISTRQATNPDITLTVTIHYDPL
jgi:hypothetical protein